MCYSYGGVDEVVTVVGTAGGYATSVSIDMGTNVVTYGLSPSQTTALEEIGTGLAIVGIGALAIAVAPEAAAAGLTAAAIGLATGGEISLAGGTLLAGLGFSGLTQ